MIRYYIPNICIVYCIYDDIFFHVRCCCIRNQFGLIIYSYYTIAAAAHVGNHTGNACGGIFAPAKGYNNIINFVVGSQVQLGSIQSCTFSDYHQTVDIRIVEAYISPHSSISSGGIFFRHNVLYFAIQCNIFLGSFCLYINSIGTKQLTVLANYYFRIAG